MILSTLRWQSLSPVRLARIKVRAERFTGFHFIPGSSSTAPATSASTSLTSTSTSTSPSTTSTSTKSHSSKSKTGMIVGIVIGSFVGMAILNCLCGGRVSFSESVTVDF
jgi:hypothetical protein